MISKEAIDDLMRGDKIPVDRRTHEHTSLDTYIVYLSWLKDFNSPFAKEIIKNKGYIEGLTTVALKEAEGIYKNNPNRYDQTEYEGIVNVISSVGEETKQRFFPKKEKELIINPSQIRGRHH